MLRLLIIAQETEALSELISGLNQQVFVYSIMPHGSGVMPAISAHHPDLVMVEMDGYMAGTGIQGLLNEIRQGRPLPIMALVARDKLDSIEANLDIDDLITVPGDIRELVLRIKRLLNKRNGNMGSDELIKSEGLTIDLATCEVTVDGRTVSLTFREYELLKFLASNKGRVYTRDMLLDKVWGYDYYGGDRTVDVHIRRLRSKIEDANHTFIETVRNIGYRLSTGQSSLSAQ
jgi:two-component system alkaline phosphatase synthesis response regulator PhoP